MKPWPGIIMGGFKTFFERKGIIEGYSDIYLRQKMSRKFERRLFLKKGRIERDKKWAELKRIERGFLENHKYLLVRLIIKCRAIATDVLLFKFSRVDVIGPHFSPQLAAADLQQARRLVFAAVGLFQGLDDGFPLQYL